jgi:hypothetical protein
MSLGTHVLMYLMVVEILEKYTPTGMPKIKKGEHNKDMEIMEFLFFFFPFWWYLGLKSGSHTCQANAMPLEPMGLSFFLVGI